MKTNKSTVSRVLNSSVSIIAISMVAVGVGITACDYMPGNRAEGIEPGMRRVPAKQMVSPVQELEGSLNEGTTWQQPTVAPVSAPVTGNNEQSGFWNSTKNWFSGDEDYAERKVPVENRQYFAMQAKPLSDTEMAMIPDSVQAAPVMGVESALDLPRPVDKAPLEKIVSASAMPASQKMEAVIASSEEKIVAELPANAPVEQVEAKVDAVAPSLPESAKEPVKMAAKEIKDEVVKQDIYPVLAATPELPERAQAFKTDRSEFQKKVDAMLAETETTPAAETQTAKAEDAAKAIVEKETSAPSTPETSVAAFETTEKEEVVAELPASDIAAPSALPQETKEQATAPVPVNAADAEMARKLAEKEEFGDAVVSYAEPSAGGIQAAVSEEEKNEEQASVEKPASETNAYDAEIEHTLAAGEMKPMPEAEKVVAELPSALPASVTSDVKEPVKEQAALEQPATPAALPAAVEPAKEEVMAELPPAATPVLPEPLPAPRSIAQAHLDAPQATIDQTLANAQNTAAEEAKPSGGVLGWMDSLLAPLNEGEKKTAPAAEEEQASLPEALVNEAKAPAPSEPIQVLSAPAVQPAEAEVAQDEEVIELTPPAARENTVRYLPESRYAARARHNKGELRHE